MSKNPANKSQTCRGPSRRELLKFGGLSLFGLGLPELLAGRSSLAAAVNATAAPPVGKSKHCIVLFMLGGPPQHEIWDPKPEAPFEIRGDVLPAATNVPGIQVGELMPLTARQMDKICILRAMSTGDSAHSTSGYAMSTGVSHVPLGVEGAAPGAPNNHPSIAAMVKHVCGERNARQNALPASIVIPEVLANDGNKTWPGQDGGFLGRSADPWVLEGDPSQPNYQVQDLAPAIGVADSRVHERLSLLERFDRHLRADPKSEAFAQFDVWRQQALTLLASPVARRAFELGKEPDKVRDRYGRNKFGQCVLLARRLIEAGVPLVQVNWTRIEGALNFGGWDTHMKNSEALRTTLMPRMDQAYSALLGDLAERGLLEETLVVWVGEFGRTPKINPAAGRDHWGPVFSVALAGGGVRGGQVHGSSDRLGAAPMSGRVEPADLTATIFHCLGLDPQSQIRDNSGRPLPISRGRILHEIC
jgi:hypothetical protein